MKDEVVIYTLETHKEELNQILMDPNKDQHFSVVVHFVEVLMKFPKICEAILSNFFKFSSVFDSAVVQAERFDIYFHKNEG